MGALLGGREPLEAPESWTVEATSSATAPALRPRGGTFTTTWQLTSAAAAPVGVGELTATATARAGATPVTATGGGAVTVAPPAPLGTAWLSDHPWTDAANFWGPVERDRSNGETGAGDGGPLTIGGTTFAKGLGVHAPSTVTYYLGGACTRLTAQVGLDDEVGDQGAVTFRVLGEGEVLAETAERTGADGPAALDVDVTGVDLVELVADPGASPNFDHADWGALQVVCAGDGEPQSWSVTAPDGEGPTARITRSPTGRLTIDVTDDGAVAVPASALGITTSTGDFTQGLRFVGCRDETVDQSYTTVHGARREHEVTQEVMTLTFANPAGDEVAVEVRAQEDGVAYRYALPGEGDVTVTGEASAVRMPADARVWTGEQFSVNYEHLLHGTTVGDLGAGEYNLPPLFGLGDDRYVLVGEADVDARYAASRLTLDATTDTFTYTLPQADVATTLPCRPRGARSPWATSRPWSGRTTCSTSSRRRASRTRRGSAPAGSPGPGGRSRRARAIPSGSASTSTTPPSAAGSTS